MPTFSWSASFVEWLPVWVPCFMLDPCSRLHHNSGYGFLSTLGLFSSMALQFVLYSKHTLMRVSSPGTLILRDLSGLSALPAST